MVGVNKSIILTTIVAIALFALAIIPSQLWLTQDNISAWIDTWLPAGLLLQVISLYGVFTLALTFGVPRQFAAIACGYILGQWAGMLVGLFAAVSACFLTSIMARFMFADFVGRRFHKQQNAIYQFLSINEFTKALIIRLLPVGSNFLTNVVAGSCNIKLAPFIAGSALGFIPQMLIFSLVGAGVKLSSSTHILSAGALFFVALILGFWLYKQESQAKKKGSKSYD